MSAEGLEPERPAPDPELKGTEALFASLRPTPPVLDRDRVMYEAGRTAERRELVLGGSGASRRSSVRRAGIVTSLAASLLIGVWVGDRRAREDLRPASIARTERAQPPAEGASSVGEPVSPIELPADSYAELRKHLASADFDDPVQNAERSTVVPAPRPRHLLRAELLQSLN